MRQYLRTPAVLTAALAAPAVAAATLFTVAPAAAGVPVPAESGPGSAARARPVMLINGDQVLAVRAAGGRRVTAVQPATAGSGALLVGFFGCRQDLEIPAAALPYLGRGLDPGLFELSALRRAEKDGRLPVRVGFRGRLPALPGVRVTHSGVSVAQGYLTASSARVFGAALEHQFIADHARGSYGADGLFAHGVSITLAGAAGPAPARPDLPMRTLTVTGSNLAGKPDTGDDVLVFNADNCARFADIVDSQNVFYHGVARYSVPTGHYWAIGEFVEISRRGIAARISVLPQFTVTADTTVQVRERAADSKITMVTPRPAIVQQTSFMLNRPGRAGSALSVGWTAAGVTLRVGPTSRRPTVGTLQAYTSQQLTSPPGPGVPYAYNLAFTGPAGLIPAQRRVVPASDLATVDEGYYQDRPSTGAWVTFGGFPVQFLGVFVITPSALPVPGRQIQYMTANPAVLWSSGYTAFNLPGQFPSGGQTGSFRSFRAGQQVTENWNRYPLHPGVNVNLAGAAQPLIIVPSASRAGDTLRIDVLPFSDSTPAHAGAGFSADSGARITGRYQIDQDGVRLAGGNAVSASGAADFSAQVKLRPGPAVIRLTLAAARTGPRYQLSARSQTTWTWRSAHEPGAMLPPGWHCDFPALSRRCAVQPMMTLRYQVRGLALDGAAPPGGQVLAIEAGHLQLASGSAITAAAVQVSFNDGKSWQSAIVRRTSARHFLAAFTAPAGVLVTLRVSAADMVGGSIAETIQRAYRITS